jgi:hypothetical protein
VIFQAAAALDSAATRLLVDSTADVLGSCPSCCCQTGTSLVARQLTNCNNTHKMLPKNYCFKKILVVFSFFEIFCTRVGNSERFGQGEFQ